MRRSKRSFVSNTVIVYDVMKSRTCVSLVYLVVCFMLPKRKQRRERLRDTTTLVPT
jgi:hypothetical protein